MYGKNLTFKTGGVDGCDCDAILKLIGEGKIDTTPLITHTYPLEKIEEAYELFEEKRDGVIKVAGEGVGKASLNQNIFISKGALLKYHLQCPFSGNTGYLPFHKLK